MVKLLKTRKTNDVYTQSFKRFLYQLVREQKLKETKVYTCDCPSQTCRGKFLRKFEWQTHCAWEMIRLGLIENTDELTKGKRFWENKHEDKTF